MKQAKIILRLALPSAKLLLQLFAVSGEVFCRHSFGRRYSFWLVGGWLFCAVFLGAPHGRVLGQSTVLTSFYILSYACFIGCHIFSSWRRGSPPCHSYFPGTSWGFWERHAFAHQTVQLYVEPLIILCLGLAMSPFDEVLSSWLRIGGIALFFKGQLARWQAHRSLLDAQDSHLEGHQATHAVQAHLRPRSHAPPRVLIVRGSQQGVARRTLPDMIRRLDPAMRRIITEVPQPRRSKGEWGPLPIQKGPHK